MDHPGDPDFNEASAQLDQGLRSCRAILSSYRVLLAEHNPPANDDEHAPGELDGSAEGSLEA